MVEPGGDLDFPEERVGPEMRGDVGMEGVLDRVAAG